MKIEYAKNKLIYRYINGCGNYKFAYLTKSIFIIFRVMFIPLNAPKPCEKTFDYELVLANFLVSWLF